jgi:TolB-like protein
VKAAAAITVVVLAALASRAQAAERLAVLILGAQEQDAAIGDNLTEVVIGRLAQKRGSEMVGTAEFRGRLDLQSHRRTLGCLEDMACLGSAGVSLGVRRVVTGSVAARNGQFLLNLRLTNIENGQVEGRFFRLIEGGVADLVRAAQEGADTLFVPKIEPGRIRVESQPAGARVMINDLYMGTTPVLSGSLLPGSHSVRVELERRFPWKASVQVRPGDDLEIKLGPAQLPARRTWPAYVGFSSAGLSLTLAAAGGAFGILSQIEPSGQTGEQAQRDLRARQRFATTANVFFAGAAVTAVASAVVLATYRRDVFGD